MRGSLFLCADNCSSFDFRHSAQIASNGNSFITKDGQLFPRREQLRYKSRGCTYVEVLLSTHWLFGNTQTPKMSGNLFTAFLTHPKALSYKGRKLKDQD
jgi:hypothetical protein